MQARGLAPEAELKSAGGGPERRACIRYPCHTGVACHLPPSEGDDACWEGTVHDVSASGIGLVLERWFGNGRTLEVEFQNAPEGQRPRLLVMVMHATLQDDGSWLLGCAFTRKISPQELNAWL